MSNKPSMINDILAWPNLEAAWEQVRLNKAAPGIDGVTLARWGRNAQANLERLAGQVRSNTYRPNRPKRFLVAKKGGGVRELSRLTVTDKVLQRAVLNVIEAPFERRFLDCSHGYRPRRSVATAVEQVLEHRDRGLGWVLDADIHACFDSLDHALLLELIRRVIDDWFVLNLTGLWLKAGRKHRHQAVGVPMGGVLSPLWCNITLHQLDAHLTTNRWPVVRYADDFIVLARTPEEAQRAWEVVEGALAKLQLQLSPRKTRLTSFEQGFTFLGVAFQGRTYAYTWQNKRIEVEGRRLGWLYRCPPDFY